MNLWENMCEILWKIFLLLSFLSFVFMMLSKRLSFLQKQPFFNCSKISSFEIFVFLCKRPSPKIFFNEAYKKNLNWVGCHPGGWMGGSVNIVVKFKWSMNEWIPLRMSDHLLTPFHFQKRFCFLANIHVKFHIYHFIH